MSKQIVSSLFSARGLERSVLSKYNLPDQGRCRYLTGGLNDTYVVEAGAQSHYLRLYRHGWRGKPEIEAEVDMLLHLTSEGQPVSRPLPRKDGRYITRLAAPEGTRWAVVFTEAPGNPPRLNASRARAYGELVASTHVSADLKAPDARRFHLDFSHLLEEPLANIEPFLRHRPKDREFLIAVSQDLRSAITSILPTSGPQYGFCHGDHHGGNVHRDASGKLVLFDFDCYGYGWRAYDLAVMLWQLTHNFGWSRAGMGKIDRRWNGFLSGYGDTRRLRKAELTATRLFVPVRQIWWLGLHTYMRNREVWGGTLDDEFFDNHLGYVRNSAERCGL